MDNVKVYKMDDCEWWASKSSKEETHKYFLKEYGLSEDECPLNCVTECDIENDGMWDLTIDEADIERLGDLDEIVTYKHTGRRKEKDPKFGDLIRRYGEVYKFVPLKEVLENNGDFTLPYMIASTEW